jgi:hypothetical protein
MAAAKSTLDALMYALRRGISALNDGSNMRRLAELDGMQMRDVVIQLQNRTVAKSWTEDEVAALVAVRNGLQ